MGQEIASTKLINNFYLTDKKNFLTEYISGCYPFLSIVSIRLRTLHTTLDNRNLIIGFKKWVNDNCSQSISIRSFTTLDLYSPISSDHCYVQQVSKTLLRKTRAVDITALNDLTLVRIKFRIFKLTTVFFYFYSTSDHILWSWTKNLG